MTGDTAIASSFGVYRSTSGRPLVQCLQSDVGIQNARYTLQKWVGHAAGLKRQYLLPRLFVLQITVVYRYWSGRDVVAWSIDLTVTSLAAWLSSGNKFFYNIVLNDDCCNIILGFVWWIFEAVDFTPTFLRRFIPTISYPTPHDVIAADIDRATNSEYPRSSTCPPCCIPTK